VYLAVTLWSAWAVGLAVLGMSAGPLPAQENAAEKCVFAGTARNSVTRAGVGKVSIRLVPLSGAMGYAGWSDAVGAFRFSGLVAGDYRVEAVRTGYTAKWVLADPSGHTISRLHLAPGQPVAGSDLWLSPESGIAGKVMGPDSEPLRGAQITLIAREWRSGKRVYVGMQTAFTDAEGVYHCAAVAPGRYLLYAARPTRGPLAFSVLEEPGKPEMRIAGRYHPNSPQLEGAALIELHPGEEILGIDFRLPLVPVFHVTGKPPSENASVRLAKRSNDQALEWEEERASTGKDGSFDISGIAPGNYFLYSVEASSNSNRFDLLRSARIPLTVTAQDTAGLVAPPLAQFALQGRIRVEDGDIAEAIPVQIFFDGSEADEYTSFQRRAEPKADRTFAIPNLTPDRYEIRIVNRETGKEGGYYLKAVRVNGVKAAGGEIDMTGGAAPDVELILSAGVGSAEGTVKWPDEGSKAASVDPAVELTVVLIPESVPSGDNRPVTAYLDQDGRFRVTDLEPGSYRALATTNYDKDLWRNAEFLRLLARRGTPLEVTEKGTARVEAPLLPAGEVRQAEEQIQ